jgi:hypothetical protein
MHIGFRRNGLRGLVFDYAAGRFCACIEPICLHVWASLYMLMCVCVQRSRSRPCAAWRRKHLSEDAVHRYYRK